MLKSELILLLESSRDKTNKTELDKDEQRGGSCHSADQLVATTLHSSPCALLCSDPLSLSGGFNISCRLIYHETFQGFIQREELSSAAD